jgi:hypothetical protein
MRRACLILRLALVLFAGGASLVVSPTLAAADPIAIGVNIANAPDDLTPMQAYASQAGRNPALVMWFQSWSEPLFYGAPAVSVGG